MYLSQRRKERQEKIKEHLALFPRSAWEQYKKSGRYSVREQLKKPLSYKKN